MAGKNQEPQPTVDEIIALLKKTSLPTAICEGRDDIIIYRRFENHLSQFNLSVLPVGGREMVLSIFERRSEIPASVKLIFLIDRDTWVNTGVPQSYIDPKIVFTDGYSIENDVFRDGNFFGLLVNAEAEKFIAELKKYVEWYALALFRHLTDKSIPISKHPDHVLDSAQFSSMLALDAHESYPVELRNKILSDYQKLLRGKSLLELLIRNTNSRKKQPKHSTQALLELVAARPGPLLASTLDAVSTCLQT